MNEGRPIVKTTPYFVNSVMRRRPYVSIELCKTVIENPARVEMQADGRIRYWGQVGKKWLRVVVENDALHNAFFDRSYKP